MGTLQEYDMTLHIIRQNNPIKNINENEKVKMIGYINNYRLSRDKFPIQRIEKIHQETLITT